MDLAILNGPMEDNIRETGTKTKCMGMEYTLGPMAKNTQVNMYMIKNKAMECLTLQTIRFTKVNGLKENSTELAKWNKTGK